MRRRWRFARWPAEIQKKLAFQPRNPDIVARHPRWGWVFCEVKRPNDRIKTDQVRGLAVLHLLTGAPVAIVRVVPRGGRMNWKHRLLQSSTRSDGHPRGPELVRNANRPLAEAEILALRFVTWNCRIGGFAKKKAKYVAAMQPDVLAIQELETLKVPPSFCGEHQPTYHDRQAHPEFPRRAIGMFSYTGLPIQAVDGVKTLYSFRRFEVRRGDLAFNVAAVWPWATKSKKTSYRQAHEGLDQNAAWINERPTAILGDFNAHQSFSGSNWSDLIELLRPFGFVSAYHRHFNRAFGQESHSTYFHQGKPESGFHLDYCFISEPWADRIANVQVDSYDKWRHVSDHVPLVVDVAV